MAVALACCDIGFGRDMQGHAGAVSIGRDIDAVFTVRVCLGTITACVCV